MSVADRSSEETEPSVAIAPPIPAWAAGAACVASLGVSFFLLTRYRVLSGPGDQLVYFDQAARLIPFTHHYYGPGYFATLRAVRDLLGTDWFLAGKLVSWFSAAAVLLFTHRLARRVLKPGWAAFCLALVALNPHFITASYDGYTFMFGTAWSMAGILAAERALVASPAWWLPCGVLFGLGSMTRFQNNVFLIGVVVGLSLVPGLSTKGRLARVIPLVLGAMIPPSLWSVYLHRVQDGPPVNYNYVHLTWGLGEFTSFFEVDRLVEKYRSTMGVLTAHWSNPFRIGVHAARQLVGFPFARGFELLFITAGWLLPAAFSTVLNSSRWSIWGFCLAIGLIFTAVGPGWVLYYVSFVPLLMILLTTEIARLRVEPRLVANRLGAIPLILLAATVAWSGPTTRQLFRAMYWEELDAAKEFLNGPERRETLVCSTAASLAYDGRYRFVDQSTLMRPEQSGALVAKLREKKVDYLVVTERHTLLEFPDLEFLLKDEPPKGLDGLRRELLVTTPKRLAIYRVTPPNAPAAP